ncbi:hypothetical protein BU16DRAFT_537119 [Lophium mytilinum]|uniref:Ig-like domain-containing protein n=1 Tax=Lophium mytilinum TaxID=390894 RepID=A0A6A6R0U8_9PEZI|nr:hypothetical protein BU16DRAFT_537119 [Lophium mytilinum]
MKKRHRFRFFGLLFLCALLGGVVGPAIATLLQPQLDFWPAGGTDLWLNSTLDRLFPPTLDMSTLPTLECATTGLDVCPTAGWETMNDWLRILYFTDRGDDYGRPSSTSWIPSTLSIPAQTVSLEPFYTIRPPVDDEFFAFSWMKLPHVGLAQALSTGSHLWWSAAIRASQNYGKGSRLWDKVTDQYSFVHLSPEVQTQCNHTLYNATALKACVPFRQAESPWETIEQCDNEAIEAWVSNDLENTRPTVHWIDGSSNWNGAPNISDLNLPGGYNAAALVTLPKTVSKDVHAIGCSVRVQYGVGTYTTESLYCLPKATSGFGVRVFLSAGWVPLSQPRPQLQTGWLNDLNPTPLHSNTSIFEQMLITAGVWDPHTNQSDPVTSKVEAILLFLIANGMARTDPYATTQSTVEYRDPDTGEPTNWWQALIPKGVFDYGGNAFKLTPEQRIQSMRLHMNTDLQGYAYGYHSGSGAGLLFSGVVVIIYVALSLVLLVSFWIQHRWLISSSWHTSTEILALALGSEALPASTSALQNTSVGIHNLSSLQHKLRLIAKDGKVQIVLAEEPGPYIRPNVEY